VRIDPSIDALYQVPLEQFTEKRNSLAKEMTGEARTQIKTLQKPPVPVWAVNQLYWNDRSVYDALVDASEKLRSAHRAALAGRKADIRKADELYRAALERAFNSSLKLVEKSRGPVTDAVRETIRKTLAALPNDEAAGRLTRAPEAAGFSLLTGVPVRPVDHDEPRDKKSAKEIARAKEAQKRIEADAALARAHAQREHAKEVASAERTLKDARKAAEQARFKVRQLQADLQEAQESEATLARQVSVAERKLADLKS